MTTSILDVGQMEAHTKLVACNNVECKRINGRCWGCVEDTGQIVLAALECYTTKRLLQERENGVANLLVILDKQLLPGLLGSAEVGVHMLLDRCESSEDRLGLGLGEAAGRSRKCCRNEEGKSRGDD
jgi:hypothetical protein